MPTVVVLLVHCPLESLAAQSYFDHARAVHSFINDTTPLYHGTICESGMLYEETVARPGQATHEEHNTVNL